MSEKEPVSEKEILPGLKAYASFLHVIKSLADQSDDPCAVIEEAKPTLDDLLKAPCQGNQRP